MAQEKERGFETPQQKFAREVVAPTKKAMENAIAQATSEEDAIQKINDALPEGRSFLGPLVMYMERDMGGGKKQKSIKAIVGTLDNQNNLVKIEAEFVG